MRMLAEVIRGSLRIHLSDQPRSRLQQSDQPSGTLAGKRLELNGLKEAGLITLEEFEAKKKQLLGL